MDGIGGTVKKLVFRGVKAERAVINSTKRVCEVVNRVILVTSLYKFKNCIMKEPAEAE